MEPARSYRDRIVRVYDYIKRNIAGDLSIDRLSDVACLSPYHFHRVYKRFVGETLNGAVRRCRMYQGGKLLTESGYSIAEIAYRTGYNRTDSFSRAFQRFYGCSPDRYQRVYALKVAMIARSISGGELTPESMSTLSSELSEYYQVGFDATRLYEVEIVDRARIEIIGLHSDSTQEVLEPKFVDLNLHAQNFQLQLTSPNYIGVFYKDYLGCGSRQRVSNFAHRRAVAAMAISAQQREMLERQDYLPFKLQSIPAGRYVSLVHRGAYSLSDQSHEWLIGHWLPKHGLRAAADPVIEQYLNDPRTTGPSQLRTQILVRIED